MGREGLLDIVWMCLSLISMVTRCNLAALINSKSIVRRYSMLTIDKFQFSLSSLQKKLFFTRKVSNKYEKRSAMMILWLPLPPPPQPPPPNNKTNFNKTPNIIVWHHRSDTMSSVTKYTTDTGSDWTKWFLKYSFSSWRLIARWREG